MAKRRTCLALPRIIVSVRSTWFLAALALAACRPAATDDGADAAGTTGSDTSVGDSDTGDSGTGTTTGAPQNECDLCQQDCPDGSRCVPASEKMSFVPEKLVCTPEHPDPQPLGERCQIDEFYGAGKDDCELGAFCVLDELAGLTGFCQQLCCPGAAETGCAANEICELFFTGYDQVPPVPICMPECDPLQPLSCDEAGRPGWTCIPTDFAESCRFLCVPPTQTGSPEDLGDQSEDCLLWSDCKPGLHCRPAETVGCAGGNEGWCCTAFCDPSEPDICPDPLQCISFGCEDPTAAHVGACVLPGG